MKTRDEIHAMFDQAVRNGTWFEYECCLPDDGSAALYVRNTEMEYCTLLTPQEAKLFRNADPDHFYEVIRSDDTDFSPNYIYFYDETSDEYYAVRKKRDS